MLEIHLHGDLRPSADDGDFGSTTTVTSAGISPQCRIMVFNDLSDVRVPDGTTELTEPVPLTPVKQSPVSTDGSLFLYLPPSRYSVLERGCFVVRAPYFGGIGSNLCCTRVEATPDFQEVRTTSGEVVYHVQTIDLRAGETTRLSLAGKPAEMPSRLRITVITAILGISLILFVLAPTVFLVQWWTRHRLRRRGPVIAKELGLTGMEQPAATFDDIFGTEAPAKRVTPPSSGDTSSSSSSSSDHKP